MPWRRWSCFLHGEEGAVVAALEFVLLLLPFLLLAALDLGEGVTLETEADLSWRARLAVGEGWWSRSSSFSRVADHLFLGRLGAEAAAARRVCTMIWIGANLDRMLVQLFGFGLSCGQ